MCNATTVFTEKANHIWSSSRYLILKGVKKWGLFYWAKTGAKPPLGPSVTVSCAHTHAHTHRRADILTAPPAVRAGKTCVHHVMFQSLCQEWSVWTPHTLNSPLFSHFVTVQGVALEGSTCCHNTEKWNRATASLNSNQWVTSENSTEICWPRDKSVSQSSKSNYTNSLI